MKNKADFLLFQKVRSKTVKKFGVNLLDSSECGDSRLVILTGGEFAYRREDGVLVVPLGCLRD